MTWLKDSRERHCNWMAGLLTWVLQAAATATILLTILAWAIRERPGGLCQLHQHGQRCMFNALLRSEDVRWSTADDTIGHLRISGCPLKRYTAAEARQCMAGKRLVLLGDSVTRFQYVVLAYFLHTGSWPQPVGDEPDHPSIVNNKAWHSVTAYTKGTNALFDGREQCDCTQSSDNRHYVGDDFSLHYLRYSDGKPTSWANGNISGHFGFPPHSAAFGFDAKGNSSIKTNARVDWNLKLTTALTGPVAQLKPTHLILNSGLHSSTNFWSPEYVQQLAVAGKSAVAGQRGRVFWKTTTATLPTTVGRSSRDHDATALEAVRRLGWGVLDAFALTRPLLDQPQPPWWDEVHFEAGVYRELNLYLLNMICSE